MEILRKLGKFLCQSLMASLMHETQKLKHMKLILILIILIWTIAVNGQIEPIKGKILNSSLNSSARHEKTDNDTIPSVIFVTTNNTDHQSAYFINGKHSTESILRTIDPQFVDSIKVLKEEIEIEGKIYYGQLYIQMKKDYNPKLISLTDLKLKYKTQGNTSTIFMIDNDIIKGDYSKCIVDEKYILRILVDKIENKEENLQVDIIRLLTKTEENIKKSKEIIIRGREEVI